VTALFAAMALLALPARAETPGERAADCLERFDLACAQGVVGSVPYGTEREVIQAVIAVHEGEYAAALAAAEALEGKGVDLEEAAPDNPVRNTAEAAQGMLEAAGDGVRIRTYPGVDAVLVEDAVDVLAAARKTYDGLFGGGPAHDIVLDIFPTESRFILASGLPPEAVRTTNVIALSKWTRLLLTSPRAMSRGYAWKDTACHEYIHLVVAYRTGNRAPVWLQEGLAKHLEGWWRGGRGSGLSPHHESLLADAVRTGEFVPFEKFARSMAYLDSGEEAALAFAQVATMVQFMLEKAGPERLPELMDRVRGGEAAMSAFANLAGFDDFDAFRGGWVAWLRTQPLVQEDLGALPVVRDGEGDDYASDPLLAANPDKVRFARIGDLLRERGRCDAALIEYEKAASDDGPPSPLLMASRAKCHAELDQMDEAIALVDEGVALYPEFTLLQTTRGSLLDTAGRRREALPAWKAAHDINPYDPSVQDQLVRHYNELGQADLAKKHLRYLRILQTGGVGDGG
jgi:tetratricopeptide (TPR) repeat protein